MFQLVQLTLLIAMDGECYVGFFLKQNLCLLKCQSSQQFPLASSRSGLVIQGSVLQSIQAILPYLFQDTFNMTAEKKHTRRSVQQALMYLSRSSVHLLSKAVGCDPK